METAFRTRAGVGVAVVSAAIGMLLVTAAASCGSFSGDDGTGDAAEASSPETSQPASDASPSGDGAGMPDAEGGGVEAGVDGGAARHLRVFVLATPWSISTSYPPSGTAMYSGRDSADHYCADEGMANGLGSSFVAWMSLSGSDAIARLPADADWSLPNASGAPDLVFASRAALDLAMNPMRPLNRSATGQPIAGAENRVWTGTDTTGRASGTDCDDWGIFSTGTTGRTDSVGPAWTSAGPSDCGAALHVFCFGY